jgi:hypothetical protein
MVGNIPVFRVFPDRPGWFMGDLPPSARRFIMLIWNADEKRLMQIYVPWPLLVISER